MFIKVERKIKKWRNKIFMNELEKQLDEYINQNIYNYAFMIKGQWGSGKSYFIKKVYKEKHPEKEFIYVSLNGIEKIEDIDIKLTETLIKEHLGKGKLKSINLKNILKDLFKQVNYKNIVGILNKEYKQILTESIIDVITDKLSKSNVVLIFDDLERCKVQSDKLLAYINNYVEHQEIKTILVADETNIEEEDYKKIREKVIGNSIEYIPDIKNNIKSLLPRINNQKIRDIIERNIGEFNNELECQNFCNMRTVQFAIDKFVNFYEIIFENSEYEDEEYIELQDRIFNYLVYISILYKKSENLYDWKDLEYGYINIKDDYSYENYRYGFKFIDDYVVKGIIDKEKILFILKDYDHKNLPKDDAYELLKNRYWELQDDKVYELIKEIKNKLKNQKYRIEMISEILSLLLKLEEFGYQVDMNEFMELFKNLIKNKQGEDNTIYIGDTLELINMNKEVKEKYLKEFEKLKNYSMKLKFANINDCITEGNFNKLLENDFWTNNQKLIEKNGFFSNINLEKLMQSIKRQDKAIEIWNLKYFCDALLENYQFGKILKKDMESIKYLLKQLKELHIDEYGISKRNAIKGIVMDLEKMQDYKK